MKRRHNDGTGTRSYRNTLGIALVCLLSVVFTQATGEDRTIDGTGNNTTNTSWGATDTQLRRVADVGYDNGVSEPGGALRPSARHISNQVAAQSGGMTNSYGLTSFIWQWGQFVDHDIDLTGPATPTEAFPIDVPTGDSQFDPLFTGTQTIPLDRSAFDSASGTGIGNPRQQINQITSFIDASNVYGSDAVRAAELRTLVGGKLKTSAGNMLPFNTAGLPNANAGPLPDNQLFLAGDVRGNEQIGLTAMHTLFVREHNQLADELATANPGWNDETIYQRARKIVGAQMQVVTYNEFLPMLLGPGALDPYLGYDDTVDPSIANEFSTALYRLGHSMLPSELARVEVDGTPSAGGPLPLRDAFFNPTLFSDASELDRILKGLASQRQQEVDNRIVDDVRNFLFGPPGSGGFDLASLNIQRGRDHGLADYNTARLAYDLGAAVGFDDITSDVVLQAALADLYGSVDDVDLWVGALAEDHQSGAAVGPLIAAALAEQFERLRDGDRFWYENDEAFSPTERQMLSQTRLAEIVMRNTAIDGMQTNAFQAVPEPGSLALAIILLATGSSLARRRRIRQLTSS